MAIEFDTTPYTRSHGNEPKGRGAWAFGPSANPDDADVMWSPSMTYSDARIWVRDELKARFGITTAPCTVYVLP